MSKERAQRRAERAALAQRREAQLQAARQREQVRRRRRRAWTALATPLRWRGGAKASARTKERRAVIASTLLVVLVLTYLMTDSIAMVIGMTLVASIATPALVAVFFDRSNK